MPRPSSKRAQLIAEAEALERKLRALEEPRIIRIILAFDPRPMAANIRSRLGGPVVDGEEPMARVFPPGPLVTEEVAADGSPCWVIHSVVVA